MKTQTLFLVASAIIGALAAPVQRREAEPDVITYYENVVHIVTSTSTVWVAPNKPTPTPAPEKKVEEVKEEEEEPEVEEPEPEVETPAPEPSPEPEPVQEEEQEEAATADQQESTSGGASVHTGDGTYYTPAMGSCGSDKHTEADLVAALPKAVMEAVEGGNPNNNPLCGKSVQVTRGSKKVKVIVVDKCMGCAPDDIDLSPAAFKQLGAEAEGRITVSWSIL